MRMKSILAKLAVITLLAGTLAAMGLGEATSAFAAYNPCGTYSNPTSYSQVGATTFYTSGSAEGISGLLTYQTDALCTAGGSVGQAAASSWNMIGSESSDSYSQSGQEYVVSLGCARHFAEQEKGIVGGVLAPVVQVFGTCVTGGQTHQAWELFQPSCSCEEAIIDSTVFIASSYNPNSFWAQPWQIRGEGETTITGSDAPGTPTAKSTDTTLQFQTPGTNAWALAGCGLFSANNVGPSAGRFTSTLPSCTEVDFWTTRTGP